MALGDLTRQIAKQALGEQMKEVLEGAKPAGPAQPEGRTAVILGQVQAMQRALKDDEELVVTFQAGSETIRVLEFFVPSPHVLVVAGLDANRNVTRVIVASEAVQLICKPSRLQPGAKATRIAFIAPKAKAE